MGDDDFRSKLPRFVPEAMKANQAMADLMEKIGSEEADDAGADRAGLVARAEAADRADPVTTKLHRLEENLGAADVTLTSEDLREIEEAKARAIPKSWKR